MRRSSRRTSRPKRPVASLGELSGFIVEHIRTKRARPGADLVSLLVGSEVDGEPLSREELFMFLLTLLVAGNETTRTLLSGSAVVLDEHPDQRADLAADPSLLPGAMEECLRWVTPVHAFCRTATEDAAGRRHPGPGRGLSLHALRLRQPRRARLRSRRGALRRAPRRPSRSTWRSGSASTSAWEPAWPAWRRGCSSRNCWPAFPTTPSPVQPSASSRRRWPASGPCRWCWRPAVGASAGGGCRLVVSR